MHAFVCKTTHLFISLFERYYSIVLELCATENGLSFAWRHVKIQVYISISECIYCTIACVLYVLDGTQQQRQFPVLACAVNVAILVGR